MNRFEKLLLLLLTEPFVAVLILKILSVVFGWEFNSMELIA